MVSYIVSVRVLFKPTKGPIKQTMTTIIHTWNIDKRLPLLEVTSIDFDTSFIRQLQTLQSTNYK